MEVLVAQLQRDVNTERERSRASMEMASAAQEKAEETEQENGLINSTPTCDNVKLSYSDLTTEMNQVASPDNKVKIEGTPPESSEESSSDVWLGKSVSENRVPEMAVIKAGHQLVSALNYIHDIGKLPPFLRS